MNRTITLFQCGIDLESGKIAQWSILRNAILRNGRSGVFGESRYSVRRHRGFNLLPSAVVELHTDPRFERIVYSIPTMGVQLNVLNRVDGTLTVTELASHQSHGVDNTGNVCIWPSEEVLAYLVTQNPDLIRDKTVLELGAGMTGLAGMCCSLVGARKVVITDGNPDCVERLKECIEMNKETLGTDIQASLLVWNSEDHGLIERFGHKFDLIISADCLFFTTFHDDLIHVVESLLAPNVRTISDKIAVHGLKC